MITAWWTNTIHGYGVVGPPFASPDTQRWKVVEAVGTIPSIRSCPSWARRGNSVYMFGGYDGVQRMNDFFEFRLGVYPTCTLLCCPPVFRTHALRTCVCVCVCVCADTYTWSLIPTAGKPPSPRYFHSCAFYGKCVLVLVAGEL